MTSVTIYISGYPTAETVAAGRRSVAKLPSANERLLLRRMTNSKLVIKIFSDNVGSAVGIMGLQARSSV